MLAHPNVAAVSCGDCKQWVYNDDWTPMKRPIPRNGQPPPCHRCPKIPEGAEPCPENAAELTPQLVRVWLHYEECKAVGEFPPDPLVREHARVLRAVEDAVDRARAARIEEMLKLILTTPSASQRG